MRRLLLLLPFLFLLKTLAAQDFSQNLKTAERLFEEGKYADAAEFFEAAWRQKTGRADLIFRAGECYYWAKDYRKAADCWRNVTGRDKDFELVTLKYARALKQDGRYQEAMKAFKSFENTYGGKDRPTVVAILQTDIKGCELGIELTSARQPAELPIEIRRLPDDVNTPENEFAPVPFSDDILYFSSMVSGSAKIYRTQRIDGNWVQSSSLKDFPVIGQAHFGNGVLAPDGKRFYFTECGNYDFGNGLRAKCELFVTKRLATGWAEPEKLRDYINMPGFTTTQPCIVHDRGIEFLYFSSDRDGGETGMDIWMCQRVLDGSEDIDFSFPQNLGPKINTAGDEITPFFDPASQTLYFSSNGQISLGGFDILKSIRVGAKWTKPENLGIPWNSTCDDFSFSLKKSGNGGFFVSNRLFGNEKTSTRHEDIFEFVPKETRLEIVGQVTDEAGKPLSDCVVGLFEIIPGDESRLLQMRPTADGRFRFAALPGKNYQLEAAKDGYETVFANAGDQAPDGYRPGLKMKPADIVQPPPKVIKMEPIASVSTTYEPSKKNLPNQKGAEKTATKPTEKLLEKGNGQPVAAAKTGGAVIYKIQLLASDRKAENEPLVAEARPLGEVSSEWMENKKLWRIMLGEWAERPKALEILRQAKANGFPQAFLVKYVDGQRQ